MTSRLAYAGLAALVACAGCVSHAELAQRDQQIMRLIQDQRRQIDNVRKQMEHLENDVETGGGRRRSGSASLDRRLTTIEDRLTRLDGGAPVEGTTPMPGEVVPGQPLPGEVPPGETPPGQVAVGEPAPEGQAVPGTKLTADWDASLQSERAAVAQMDVPERADFEAILNTLSQRDCGPAVSRLNAFAASHKTSPLADDALYWAGRCYILMGDSTPQRSTDFYNQAIAKFYDLGTTYPEGEKTPAALWEQGRLFLEMGDEPDARIVFSRLIRDYPASSEAGLARQKLADLQR